MRHSGSYLQSIALYSNIFLPLLYVSLMFTLNNASAVHNMKELRKYGNDLHTYITSNKHSFMGYGSEFRPKHVLEKKNITPQKLAIIIIQLTRGSSWPLSSIPEEDRKAKNLEFIARGNHVKLLCPVRVVSNCLGTLELRKEIC
jgi:hypothetical protein